MVESCFQEAEAAVQALTAELAAAHTQVEAINRQADEAWELYNAERGGRV